VRGDLALSSLPRLLRQEGIAGLVFLLFLASIVWVSFLKLFWGVAFQPHVAFDDDTMHKTVIYFMIRGQDFYTAWRHAAVVCGDLSDLRIYRTPLVFYAVVVLTGWAGDFFVFPLSVVCVLVAVANVVLSFWTTRRMVGSGRAGLAAALVQYAYFFNVVPRFMISIFAMPFLTLAVYFAWRQKPWLAGGSLALSFLIKEVFAFALPAFLVLALIRRRWRDMLAYGLTFSIAGGLYLLHVVVSQPIADPSMLLAATPAGVLLNLGGFIWFGFINLYYNVFLPVTIGGLYPFSPLPPVLPYPLLLAILGVQVLLVWGPLLFWVGSTTRRRELLHQHLALFGFVLWLVPLVIAATTLIPSFPLWWVDFAIWRWFAPSYVGFQLLVAAGWRHLGDRCRPRTQGSEPLSAAKAPEATNLLTAHHGRASQVSSGLPRGGVPTCRKTHQRYKKRLLRIYLSVANPLGEGHQSVDWGPRSLSEHTRRLPGKYAGSTDDLNHPLATGQRGALHTSCKF
jgi:hypothetical protein